MLICSTWNVVGIHKALSVGFAATSPNRGRLTNEYNLPKALPPGELSRSG